MLKLAALFLLLSGIASLTYQVVWVRLLGLSMGSTSASISTVLAAFFLGLAIGSYLAERITRNRIDSFKPYIVLEIVIGVAGLALLPVLLNLDALMAASPALGATIPMKFTVTISLLLIPTVCMGATFPVMASILIRRKNEVGVRVSQLYSLNTAGAVLGAALAGFFFVPNWGLDGAIYIAFTINLIIVVMGFYLNSQIKLPPIESSAPEEQLNQPNAQIEKKVSTPIADEAPLRGRALIVLFATGLVAIATEVGWTKYLSIFTGTTIYGFAAILTIFLIGIASGSWAIKSHLERMQRPELWMAYGLVLLGGLLLLTRAGLTMIPPVYQAINHFPVSSWLNHGVKYLFVFLLLFPPTFLFGALFPLNLKLYCGNLHGVRTRIGKAYAVNTVASIFGSIIAGFWLIPDYGTDVLLTVMAFALLVLPFLFIPALPARVPRIALASFALITIASSWLFPHLNYRDLISSVQYDDPAYIGKVPDYLYLKEGKAGVISMVTYDGQRVRLQNNGLNESYIDIEDENKVILVESLLGLVPYLLHDDPKSAFIVGFGGGVTTKALANTQNLESIHVVELEPAVVEAVRVIRGGDIPVLKDPRIQLDFNDARNTLLVEDKSYDIIAAQPSHPWLARASNVFTREFFELAESRLNKGGIYGHWVNLFYMDTTTLKSILKAFYEIFPYGMTFAELNYGDLIMIGSSSPIKFDFNTMAQRLSEPQVRELLNYHAIYKPRDLMYYFSLSHEQLVKLTENTVPNTDTNIISEVRLSALVGDPVGDEDPFNFLYSNYSFHVSPYFSEEERAQRLYDLGIYYLAERGMEVGARLAADQLIEVAPAMSRGLYYEILWRRFDHDAAQNFYAEHDEWPDRTHNQQALLLASRGAFNEAVAIIPRISSTNMQRILKARLLFEEKRFDELAAIKPQVDAERLWQLTALSRTDLKGAGAQLHSLVQRVSPGIPQLKVLAGYYGAINDQVQLDKVIRLIVRRVDNRVERIKTYIDEAINDENQVRAQFLLKQLDKFHPEEDYELRLMRNKVKNLHIKKQAKAA